MNRDGAKRKKAEKQKAAKLENLPGIADLLRETMEFLPPTDKLNSTIVSHIFSDTLPKPTDILKEQSTLIQSLARGYITRAKLPPMSDKDRSILSAKSGNVTRALDIIANTINMNRGFAIYGLQNKAVLSDTYMRIYEFVSKKEDIERALAIANNIPLNIYMRMYEFEFKKGDIERALAIANKIPGVFHKGSALKEISEFVLEKGDIKRALEIANTIPDDIFKSLTLMTISRFALIKYWNKKKALAIAKTIPVEVYKSQTINKIQNSKFTIHGWRELNHGNEKETVRIVSNRTKYENYELDSG